MRPEQRMNLPGYSYAAINCLDTAREFLLPPRLPVNNSVDFSAGKSTAAIFGEGPI